MSFPIRTNPRKRGIFHSTALMELTSQLQDIAHEMVRDGLEDEAASLRTTIGDLRWQCEELIDKELVAQWPDGPRRPPRSPTKLSRSGS